MSTATADPGAGDGPIPTARSQQLSPWFGAAGLLLLATLLAAVFVQARQYALLDVNSRYQGDYLVLSLYQTEIEYLRLREQWQAQAAQPGTPARLALRYEIFLSRVALLANNRAQALMGERSPLQPALKQIDQFRQRADKVLAGAAPAAMDEVQLRALGLELQALGEPIHGMVLAATHQLAQLVTDRQAQLQNHNRIGLALTGFLLAMLLVFALIALQQMRQLERRRRAQQALVDQLRLARREAETANAAKTEFLADMSHELRTPLNGLIGMLSLAHDAPQDPRAAGWLAVAQDSAAHLLRLLDDTLDLSKLESEALVLSPQPVHLGRLLQEVLHLLRPAADAKALQLVLQVDPALPEHLLADPTRLRQVLLNLLANAIKFSDTGAVLLDCRIAQSDEGQAKLQLEVADTGIGMDPATLARLFQRFSRSDDPRALRQVGTGLGLAISRKLVRLMGGELSVRSAPGQGSVFAFAVALQARPAPAAAAAAPPPSHAQCLHVLVAEDHPVNQLYLAALLQHLGHQVVVVADGQAALRAVTAQADPPFDLVLMDMHMPVMDGASATAAIRRLGGGLGQVCVVALTADVFAQTRDRCLQAGMDEVLCKPLAMADLRALLSRRFGPATALDVATPASGALPPPAMTPAAGPQLLDHEAIRGVHQVMGSDKAPALYKDFFEQVGQALGQMREAMRQADSETLRRSAHTVRGAALNLGLPALAAAAELVNRDAGSEVSAAEQALSLQRLEGTVSATHQLWRLQEPGD